MISASNVEVRIGARTLLVPTSFRVNKGDRIGLVGRNGAGKTTLTRLLAATSRDLAKPSELETTSELADAAAAISMSGQITSDGAVGYLPQDTHVVDPHTLAMDRVLAARGLDYLTTAMAATEQAMTDSDPEVMTRALERYPKLEARFLAAGGYAAQAEAHQIVANLGIDDRVLAAKMGELSGGQRRRVELARILFSGAATLLLDEPTNHLDVDSIRWLREFLKNYPGGFIVISHDVELLRAAVNKVWHLDATRAELDQYNLGWDAYLLAREQDERRRKRERANAEKKASALLAQAETMRAKATKAVAAQQMIKRAEAMLAATATEQQREKVAHLRFPTPAPCGKTPLTADGLSKSYGSLEVFTDVDLAIDRGSRVVVLGLNGAGKTTLLRLLASVEAPDTGEVIPGHGLKLGYYAQEHDTLDLTTTVLENLRHAAPDLTDAQVRGVLGSFLFSGDDAEKPARVLSGGEKTRLALATLVVSSANVLLLDEPTNNLDPASRAEILGALETYQGAIVMVTHDDGAVDALHPQRVLLLPDGDEDLWNDEYRDLVSLA